MGTTNTRPLDVRGGNSHANGVSSAFLLLTISPRACSPSPSAPAHHLPPRLLTTFLCVCLIFFLSSSYIARGDQRPKTHSQMGHRPSLWAVSSQRTWQFVWNIRRGDVIVILRPTLDEFLSRVEARSPPPFVLVSVNSDDPVTPKHRKRIVAITSIVAFFANNLMRGVGDHKCFPLPLGDAYSTLVPFPYTLPQYTLFILALSLYTLTLRDLAACAQGCRGTSGHTQWIRWHAEI